MMKSLSLMPFLLAGLAACADPVSEAPNPQPDVAVEPDEGGAEDPGEAREPQLTPCDDGVQYTLTAPYPMEDPADAWEAIQYTVPDVESHLVIIGKLNDDLARASRFGMESGAAPEAGCEDVHLGESSRSAVRCSYINGVAFSGTLTHSAFLGMEGMRGDQFEYHSAPLSLYYSLDGIFMQHRNQAESETWSTLDTTIVNGDDQRSYAQSVCMTEGAVRDRTRGYVNVRMSGGPTGDFLVNDEETEDEDGQPVRRIELSGSAVAVFSQSAQSEPGCWDFSLDGEAQGSFCP